MKVANGSSEPIAMSSCEVLAGVLCSCELNCSAVTLLCAG
jgi:hypothetical protein